MSGRGAPQRIDVECVSAAMDDVLGTPPMLGRWFSEADARAGAVPVIVLTFELWQRGRAQSDGRPASKWAEARGLPLTTLREPL